MIFYCDLQGNLKAFQNETVYQGSNNVTTIYVVAPFSRPVGLNISFTKPNKLVTSPAIMKWVGTLGNVKIPVSFVNIPEQFTDTYNVWAYALPYSITEQNGVVGVSVNAVIADSVDASGQQAYKGNLTTFTGQFTVAYSALPSPPTDIPTEWTQDKVLDLLNNYYNDAIQKIGEMNTLKTNAKDTLVKAINEVFDEIASTNATIGDLSTLTTDEKTTIVGAINEVDNHADTAQQTAETAQTTADNATTLANNAVATANGAVATANGAKTIAEQAKTIATNSVYSVSFEDIQSAVTALNGYDNAYFKVGNSIYLKQKDVPDMWVYAVASEYIEYTYTTDDDFVNALLLGTVQVGYYVLANLESTGDYDVLKDIPIINQDLSADGFTPVENTYYRHTGTTSETYTAGVIYFYNGTAYKAIDGAGGEVPTSLPATGAKITGNLPTSGWTVGSIIGTLWSGNITTSYSYEGTSISTDTNLISYLRSLSGSGNYIYVASSWGNTTEQRKFTWQDGETDQVWFSSNYGTIKVTSSSVKYSPKMNHTDTIYAIGKESTDFSMSQRYTISDTAIKANSTVTMYLNSADEVRAYSKADGSVVVEMDAVPTFAIPYTLQVVETSAEGAFEIVNGYVPTIPETPTALPQEASALKSGNLPTSGWSNVSAPVWTGAQGNSDGKKKLFNIGVTWESQDAMPTTGWTVFYYNSPTEIITNTNKWSKNDGGIKLSIDDYFNLKIMPNGDVYFWTISSNLGANYYILTELTQTTLSKQGYTISDTSITANSDILMELTDEGGVKANALANGSITVIRDTVPTSPIPYTYKVKQTNASGQFTVINHFVPSIPESPTSLPVTYKKVSGNLPTSGWAPLTNYLFNGRKTLSASNYKLIVSGLTFPEPLPTSGWKINIDESGYTDDDISGTYSSSNSTDEYIYLTFSWGNTTSGGKAYLKIYYNGSIYAMGDRYITLVRVWNTNIGVQGYTISDTAIKANSTVSMYLNSADEVRAYSKADGSVTVEMDAVPTTAIPYTLQVVETSAEGAFEIVNSYVPTKTSQLTNDSGFITAADIPSATTLYEDSTGAATVTLSETINNGDIVRIKTNNGNVDNYYIGVAWNRAITVTESLMVTDESDVTVGTAINIYSLRFNIQDTSLILFHYFKTNITTAGAVTITNEKANVVIRKVERIHT